VSVEISILDVIVSESTVLFALEFSFESQKPRYSLGGTLIAVSLDKAKEAAL
jgi:hypothetical protein